MRPDLDAALRFSDYEAMIKIIRTMGFWLVLLFCGFSLSRAEELTDHWEVGWHAGLSLPGGQANDLQTESFFVQATGEYYRSPTLSLGFEAGHALSHSIEGELKYDIDQDHIKDFLNVTSREDIQIYQITPFLKIGKSHDFGVEGVRWSRSYLILGAGVYHVFRPAGYYTVTKGLASSGVSVEGTQIPFRSQHLNEFGINFGYGFGVRVWTHYRLGVDLRYHRIFQNPNDFDYWVPTLRFHRFF